MSQKSYDNELHLIELEKANKKTEEVRFALYLKEFENYQLTIKCEYLNTRMASLQHEVSLLNECKFQMNLDMINLKSKLANALNESVKKE